MPEYRKKPVVIEARKLKTDSLQEIMNWLGDDLKEWCWDSKSDKFWERYVKIRTLEGEHIASEGDYIIKGVKGEFYPCKSDIFELTYEEVTNV